MYLYLYLATLLLAVAIRWLFYLKSVAAVAACGLNTLITPAIFPDLWSRI